MPTRMPLSFRLAAVLACFGALTATRAELIKVSPFLPPQNAATAATSNAPIEFRGVMEFENARQFRVVLADPTKRIGTWLKAGERDANLNVTIKSYHPESDMLDVEYGGQAMTLKLKESKVVSSGTAMPMLAPPPIPAPAANVSPAIIQTVVPNPTAADEQRRLEAVAAEVARRRALREQSAQGGQPAPAIPPGSVNATRQDLQQAQQLMQPQRR